MREPAEKLATKNEIRRGPDTPIYRIRLTGDPSGQAGMKPPGVRHHIASTSCDAAPREEPAFSQRCRTIRRAPPRAKGAAISRRRPNARPHTREVHARDQHDEIDQDTRSGIPRRRGMPCG